MIDLAVIVVSYNSADDLPGLLHSVVASAEGVSLEVIVVDNDSQDDSVAVARGLGVRCLASAENVGYAAAVNLGVRASNASRAALIVNADVRFHGRAVRVLFDTAMRSRAVTAPRMVDGGGRTRWSMRRDPTLRRQAGEALLGDHLARRSAAWSAMVRDPRAYERETSADWVTGAVLMVPDECTSAVGEWDEVYFLYCEEIDFCRRARLAGFPIVYLPEAVVFHEGAGSGTRASLVALDTLNKARYYRSGHGPVATCAYTLLLLLEKALRASDPTQRAAGVALARRLGAAWRRNGLPPGRALLEQLESERGLAAAEPRGSAGRGP
jgi:GT2 family glycosyltransferase